VFGRIIVGTDGSSTAEHAVDVAGELAQRVGAQLHVLPAYRPVRYSMLAGVGALGGSAPPPAWFGDDERVAAEEVVRRAGERLAQVGISADTVARLGELADALLSFPEGARRRHLLGSARGASGSYPAATDVVRDR
jgi:nucleotide-binding universal stress UspA family protein